MIPSNASGDPARASGDPARTAAAPPWAAPRPSAAAGAFLVWLGSVVLGSAALGSAVLGCAGERALTESDCAAARLRVERAWNRDAVAAERVSSGERHMRFIGDEERRIGERFAARCTELVGKKLAVAELACLERAESIEQVDACHRKP